MVWKAQVRVAVAGVLAASLSAVPAHADKWSPWIEAGGFVSTERDRAEVTAFMPLLQNERGLLFADVKGKLFSESVKEGNFAVGYRHMTEPGFNLGLWGGYDIRETETGNTFQQIAFGVEALSAGYDFRLNGFVPARGDKAAGGIAGVQLVGSQIFITGGREVALWGVEGEVGWRVPLEDFGADAERHEFRVYAGGYHFDDELLNDPVQGPRLRAEWRINDAIPGLAGSRLSFESSFQHDDYRDDQWEAGFRLRIPLGGGSAKSLSPIERRMADAIVRDTDIVTAPSKAEKAADARTGTVFDRVEYVDGTGNLGAAALAAGANSLIIVDGGNGDIEGGVVDGDVTLAGAGSTLALRGVSSGTLVDFAISGTAPTLVASGCGCGDVLELLGSNTHVTGMLLYGDVGASPLGIFLASDNQRNLHFTNLEIREMSFAAIGGGDDNEIFIDGVNFHENVTGIFLSSGNDISVRNSVMDIQLLGGIVANSDNTIVIENVEIRGVDVGSAVQVNMNNDIAIDNALFETMWDSGIDGNSGNNIVANNLTIRDTGWNSINLNRDNSLTLTNSTIEESGNDGLSAIEDNILMLSGVTFRNIDLSAIYIDEGNTLSVSDSIFEGTIGEDILSVGDTGNVLSGNGNENNAIVGGNLCTAAPGSFTGTIGFDGGPDIVDGACP